jgi:hypothetical protein
MERQGLRGMSSLAAGLMLVAGVTTLEAQHRPIRMGEVMAGSLTALDPKIQGRGPFHTYRLEAKAGDRFIISMNSGDVDAFLWVARVTGGLTESVVDNDDGGGGTNARLRFRATEAGTYYVVAQSLDAEGSGAYDLKVEVAPPPAPVVATPLTAGQVREGNISEASPLLEDENPALPYQLYTFTGTGERVRVTVRSGAFDAYVKVTKVVGGREGEVASDDDSGGGTDAMVTFTANGQYRIYARPLDASSTGAFTIALNSLPVVKISSRPIALGQTVAGTIESTDPETDGGQYFHQYAVTAQPGERLRITLRSSRFDAYLTWGRLVGTGLEDTSTDDDSAGDTDSQLDVIVPRDGSYVIRVHALGARETGDYQLTVVRQQ